MIPYGDNLALTGPSYTPSFSPSPERDIQPLLSSAGKKRVHDLGEPKRPNEVQRVNE